MKEDNDFNQSFQRGTRLTHCSAFVSAVNLQSRSLLDFAALSVQKLGQYYGVNCAIDDRVTGLTGTGGRDGPEWMAAVSERKTMPVSRKQKEIHNEQQKLFTS